MYMASTSSVGVISMLPNFHSIYTQPERQYGQGVPDYIGKSNSVNPAPSASDRYELENVTSNKSVGLSFTVSVNFTVTDTSE